MDSNVVCQISGICPRPGKAIQVRYCISNKICFTDDEILLHFTLRFVLKQGPIWPLVPVEVAKIGLSIMKEEPRKDEVEIAIGKEHPKSEAEEMQLPLERLIPYPLLQASGVNGTKACTLCEYLLHYIQDTITNPVTEVII